MKQSLFQKLKLKLKPNQYTKTIDQDIYTETVQASRCAEFKSELLPKWFKLGLSREGAEDYLRDKEIGVFLVRESTTILDCYVLSVKCSKYLHFTGKNEISNYIIVKSAEGFLIRGQTKRFNDLISLVTHCSVMRDMLPVLLNLDFYKNEFEKKKINEYFYYSSSASSTNSTSSLNSVGSVESNDL